MGQVLQRGSIARSGASGGGSPVGTETGVDNELARLGGFSEGDRWGLSKKVLGRWIRGEDMETFPEDPFETVKTRIVGGDQGII